MKFTEDVSYRLGMTKALFGSFLAMLLSTNMLAQEFSGFRPFKRLIEFESQRYLLDEVHEVRSDKFHELKLEKIIQDYDDEYGFMFVLASYTFDEFSGVVISSFRPVLVGSNMNSIDKLVNIHLNDNDLVEITNLYNQASNAKNLNTSEGISLVRRFNNRVMVEVEFIGEGYQPNLILWIDNHHRHSISSTKWFRAIKKHAKKTK